MELQQLLKDIEIYETEHWIPCGSVTLSSMKHKTLECTKPMAYLLISSLHLKKVYAT